MAELPNLTLEQQQKLLAPTKMRFGVEYPVTNAMKTKWCWEYTEKYNTFQIIRVWDGYATSLSPKKYVWILVAFDGQIENYSFRAYSMVDTFEEFLSDYFREEESKIKTEGQKT